MKDTANIVSWIERWARETPDKTALHFECDTWTYAQFAENVRKYAGQLQHYFGVQPGDRIAYLGLNSPKFLFLLFACARIGAIIVPMNWRLAQPELEVQIANSRPAVLIADENFQELWTAPPHRLTCKLVSMTANRAEGWSHFFDNSPPGGPVRRIHAADAPIQLVYTSGTTGDPKGALLSHRAILTNAENSVDMHELDANDHALVSLPFFHVGGLNILTTPIFCVGGTITLHKSFDPPAFLQDLVECGATRAPIVSAQMAPILGLPAWPTAKFPNLRSVTTGASPVAPAVYSSWQAKGVEVLQVYGATETAPIAINTSIGQKTPDIRTAGKAAARCRVKIVDGKGTPVKQGQSGEILIKGKNVMNGYWENKEETDAVLKDGWYSTGDIGYQDESGFCYIIDRKKDLIISGGENIYPAEIETLLAENDDVAEVAVIAKRDERWGEIPIAVIRLKKGARTSESELLKSLDGKIGRYKIPHSVVFVADFPRNSLGKIQKFSLRDKLLNDELLSSPVESSI